MTDPYLYQPDESQPDPLRDMIDQLNGAEAEELAEHLRARRSPSDDPWSPRQMRLLDELADALDARAEVAYGIAPVLR